MPASSAASRRRKLQHPLHRGCREPALRRGHGGRARAVPGIASAARNRRRSATFSSPSVRSGRFPDVPDDTPTIAGRQGRHHRRRHHGRRHRDEFRQCRHPGDHRGDEGRRRWTAGSSVIRRNYENTARKGRMTARGRGAPHGPAHGLARSRAARRLRPRHRSRVREHGRSRRRSSRSSTESPSRARSSRRTPPIWTSTRSRP